ncbi:uncharacterized protein LOC141597264 [Silene latifolia]|uniref:uncharacterized protein LOC141597264 n=1 Tax=Silene latifolia TaxID=37657 RepID=UPI003D7841ED
MAKIASLIFNPLRQNPNLCLRFKSMSISTQDQNLSNVAQQVWDIIREQPRWESTLISQFPSFDFSNPNFFNEVIKIQTNVFLSLRLFDWLSSNHGFSPDPKSSNCLFNALVNAKASVLAKSFLDNAPKFEPDSGLLESLLCSLFDGGFFDEGLDLLGKFKSYGICPSLISWNLVLSKAVRGKRTDVFWKLYGEMMDSGVVGDVETAGYLIQAFVVDDKPVSGYEALRQVRDGGFIPRNDALNCLIVALSKDGDFARVSEILHMMIGMNQNPDIYTYQGIIYALCKRGREGEAYKIFNDIRERGYRPDTKFYTIMLQGLCRKNLIEKAKKLWSEMGEKGVLPNEYTYNVLIYGYCKTGDLEEARKLVKEMRDRGYKLNNVNYNTLIAGLCKNGEMKEACDLFEEMPRNGVARDVLTYNSLIRGFCKQGDFDKGLHFFESLVACGLRPTTSSYTSLIELLCRVGKTQQALEFLTEMLNKGVEPSTFNRECIIVGLCKEGSAFEGFQWLSDMLEMRLVPHKMVFETVIHSLSEQNMLEAALVVLNSMLSVGFKLEHIICVSLVSKLCSTNSNSIELHIQDAISGSQVS